MSFFASAEGSAAKVGFCLTAFFAGEGFAVFRAGLAGLGAGTGAAALRAGRFLGSSWGG